MLAYIKGTIEHIRENAAVIDNYGIGYIVNASPSTLSRLPAKGGEALLHTHLQVKEDDLSLFGFTTQEELRLFKLLISVSGIGPKVAMAVLGIMSPEQVVAAVASQDAAAFSKVPGVGKKTAQRITLELQDKLKLEGQQDSFAAAASGGKQEAIDALLALGYSRSEAVKAVLAVAEEGHTTEQIVKLALKKLL